MKRLILLFAFIVGFTGYSQAEFENLKVTENVQDNAATKVVVQSANNVLNWKLLADLSSVKEYNNAAAFPVTGSTEIIYVAKDTNKLYRWNGSIYEEVGFRNFVDDSTFKVIKTTNKTIQESFSKADEALFKARGTELSEGGIPSINADPTKFNITPAVLGQIKNGTDYYAISYSGATAIPVTNISALNTYVYLDSNGVLQQQNTVPTRTEYYSKLFLARFASNGTQLIAFERLRNPSGQYSNSIRELTDFIVSANVPLKQGLYITGNANLTFNRAEGSVFKFGAGSDATPNTPSFSAVSPAQFFLVDRASIAGSFFTNVPVTQFDNGGTLTTIANNKFVAHRVYFFTSGNLVMQYGQNEFSTLDAAKAGAPTAQYVTNTVNVNGTFLGWWIVGKNATDLTNPLTSYFMPYTIGSGAGGTPSGALISGNNLADLADVSVARTNLGAENVANKSDSFTASSSTTYASTKALVDGLFTKQNAISGISSNVLPKSNGSGGFVDSRITDSGNYIITTADIISNGLRIGRGAGLTTNMAIGGTNTLGSITTGGDDIALGVDAMRYSTTSARSLAIGRDAGAFFTGLSQLTDMSNSIMLGYRANPLSNGDTNEIVLGYNIFGLGSNTTSIGNTSTQFGRWWGNLLLGTSTNNGRRLQVVGGADVDNLNITTTPTTSSGTPPLLTYNATTKAVESVPYSTFSSPANAVLLTGDQSISGNKSFTNAMSISSSSYGSSGMLFLQGNSTFPTVVAANGGSGKVITTTVSNGVGFSSNVTSSGNGLNFEGLSNGASTFTVNKTGIVSSSQYNLTALNTAPASATATGTTGEIRVTSTHIYVCTATNTWVRSALTTW